MQKIPLRPKTFGGFSVNRNSLKNVQKPFESSFIGRRLLKCPILRETLFKTIQRRFERTPLMVFFSRVFYSEKTFSGYIEEHLLKDIHDSVRTGPLKGPAKNEEF